MDGDARPGRAGLRAGAGPKPPAAPAGAGALGALVWAGTLAPGVVGRVSLGELLQSYGMLSTAVEEGREMGGLLIVAAWMGVLTLVRAGRAA
jgi:hypothetical protein